MNRIKHVALISLLTLLALSSPPPIQAAGEVDTSFLANLTRPMNGFVDRIVVQPDGKILVGGFFRVIAGQSRPGLVRLNADGTVDTGFMSPDFANGQGSGGAVLAISLQPDGKILIGGDFTSVSGMATRGIVRLNTDGSLDQTFTSPLNNGGSVLDIHVLPDNDLLIAGTFTINNANGNRSGIARINPDGSLDTLIYQNLISLNVITVLPDGRVVAGSTTNVRRFNADGVFDAGFGTIGVAGGIGTGVQDLHLLPDGKVLVGGTFTTVNGSGLIGLFRTNTTGGVDTTFNPGGSNPNSSVFGITPMPSGKLLIFGQFTIYNGVARNRATLIDSNGGIDVSVTYQGPNYNPIRDIGVLQDGKLLIGGPSFATGSPNPLTRLNADGSPDNSFLVTIGEAGAGYTILVQPDNKILVGGQFSFANNAPHGELVRFNPDGTLDPTWNQQFFQLSSAIYGLDLTPDGKILVAHWSGSASAARFHPNGAADIQYPNTRQTYDIKSLPDGKALIAYDDGIDRFHVDGSRDNTFTRISVASTGFSIYEIAIQPDGKIIGVGTFTTVSGVTRGRIVRAHPDGTIDSSFAPPGGANGNINTVVLQPDGKIIIGGDFTGVNFDTTKKYLARLNADGSLDTSFSPIMNAPILGLKLQANGKILVGGSFSFINGAVRAGLSRLNEDGTNDPSFDPGTGTNSTVWSIGQQSDGKIIYTGQFSRTNGFSTLAIGRLLNASAPQSTLFDYDGDAKADVSVFRPSENRWYVFRSSDSVVSQTAFAIAGDVPVPADYDGDLKTDVAIYRPSNGAWWYLSSLNGAQINVNWGGEAGDIPRPSDFDGDGKSDFVFFRPTNNTWYRINSAGTVSNITFGLAGDKPVRGDFDGDGKSDVAIYRPSTGDWWYQSSINNAQLAVRWGISTDIPAPADFDGDGKTDFAVYRPSTGVWYVINSSNGSFLIGPFGTPEDKPVPADYDGDGKAELAVFRPSSGIWYQLRTNGGFFAMQFGVGTDTPTPNAFVP